MSRKKNHRIPPLEQYTPRDVLDAGLFPLFRAFQREFSAYLIGLRPHACLPYDQEFKEYLRATSSYTAERGYLEKACHAAQQLAGEYDLVLGIARKGLWLSYIFHLHGAKTTINLALRQGEQMRYIPLGPLCRSDVQGKRVLLLENDVVTGATLQGIVEQLESASPASMDLLLVFNHTRLDREFYHQVKPSLRGRRTKIGEDDEGRIVLDTRKTIPRGIRRVMSLEETFDDGQDKLDQLADAIGVPVHADAAPTKVISLDLDGTVLRREFDYCLWGVERYEGTLWKIVGQHLGVTAREAYGRSLEQVHSVPNGSISPQAWIDHYQLPQSEEEIVRAVEEQPRVYDEYAAIAEVLDAYRQDGKRVILATESSGRMLEWKLQQAGLENHFDAVYSSVELTGGEKSCDFYRAILREEGILPGEAIHVGDSVVKDFFMPLHVGIRSYHLDGQPDGSGITLQRFDRLHSLRKLPEVVR